VDTSGNVYVADRDNNLVRKITAGGVVTTLAGLSNGITGSTDGTGTAARFNTLYDVAVDASGNVYVADTSNKTIRKITPAGVVTTLAGLTGSVGSIDGTGNAVRFSDPQGIAVDARGNVYVADTNNHLIRMSVFPPDYITHPAGQVVSSGANATFTANATSNVPITYQWQKDGVAISGATTIRIVCCGWLKRRPLAGTICIAECKSPAG
jgi:sugar lactone lactonase YvrE